MTSENGFWRKLQLTLDMIKFEHSLFAMPFALTGALLAIREDQFAVQGLGWKILWIIVAMVAARSAAMGFNRVVDADIDARNARTKTRHLPAGMLSSHVRVGFCRGGCAGVSSGSGRVESILPAAGSGGFGIVLVYSFTKRFTSFSHMVLGFALGSRRRQRGSRFAGRSTLAFCG